MPKRRTKMKTMSLKISKNSKAKLDDLAAQNGMSRGKVIRELIKHADPVSLNTITKTDEEQAGSKSTKENLSWALKKYIAYSLRILASLQKQIKSYQKTIDSNFVILLKNPNLISLSTTNKLISQIKFTDDKIDKLNYNVDKLNKHISNDLKIKNKTKKKVQL